jgi:hypothetical protein
MAIAAMIRIIATTISNSISEKPFCFRISALLAFSPDEFVGNRLTMAMNLALNQTASIKTAREMTRGGWLEA